MSRFFIPRLHSLTPYVPGEQPQIAGLIKLNTNENPYPPAPKVIEILHKDEADKLRLYPDPNASKLTAAIAARYGVAENQVIVGNGSDEILAFAFAAFFDKGEKLFFPDITYGFYQVFADIFGLNPTVIPVKSDFSVELAPYQGGNVVLANPNAPTGLALPLSKIEALVQANPDHIVLVDEAYCDFGEDCSALPLLEKYDNLLVVRTCSKSRSLAGGRLGYALGRPEVIADLQTVRNSFNPYNINRLTLLAGEASFQDEAYFQAIVAKIKATRGRLSRGLQALDFTLTDSAANFVFARHNTFSGEALLAALRRENILVRRFTNPLIADYLRITVGTEHETDLLLSALQSILQRS